MENWKNPAEDGLPEEEAGRRRPHSAAGGTPEGFLFAGVSGADEDEGVETGLNREVLGSVNLPEDGTSPGFGVENAEVRTQEGGKEVFLHFSTADSGVPPKEKGESECESW